MMGAWRALWRDFWGYDSPEDVKWLAQLREAKRLRNTEANERRLARQRGWERLSECGRRPRWAWDDKPKLPGWRRWHELSTLEQQQIRQAGLGRTADATFRREAGVWTFAARDAAPVTLTAKQVAMCVGGPKPDRFREWEELTPEEQAECRVSPDCPDVEVKGATFHRDAGGWYSIPF